MVNIEILPLKHEDLEFFSEVRNSCAVEFLHDSRKFTLEETTSWFEKTKPDYYVARVEDEKIGYFRTSNLDNIKKTIYIGCDIHEKYRGRGIGFRCYQEFIPLISSKYNLSTIYLEVLSTNSVAIKLYKKLGFIEDVNTSEKILKCGKFIDSIKMFLKIEDYTKHRKIE